MTPTGMAGARRVSKRPKERAGDRAPILLLALAPILNMHKMKETKNFLRVIHAQRQLSPAKTW